MALWSGRFAGGPAAEMQAFSESLSTDLRMWREDIAGSKAPATMLCEVGLLEADELSTILDGLDQVAAELDVPVGLEPSEARTLDVFRELVPKKVEEQLLGDLIAPHEPQPSRSCSRP